MLADRIRLHYFYNFLFNIFRFEIFVQQIDSIRTHIHTALFAVFKHLRVECFLSIFPSLPPSRVHCRCNLFFRFHFNRGLFSISFESICICCALVFAVRVFISFRTVIQNASKLNSNCKLTSDHKPNTLQMKKRTRAAATHQTAKWKRRRRIGGKKYPTQIDKQQQQQQQQKWHQSWREYRIRNLINAWFEGNTCYNKVCVMPIHIERIVYWYVVFSCRLHSIQASQPASKESENTRETRTEWMRAAYASVSSANNMRAHALAHTQTALKEWYYCRE